MKALIDAYGLMKIVPETHLEAYALHQWSKSNYIVWDGCPVTGEDAMWKGSGLVVSPIYPQPSPSGDEVPDGR